MAFPESRKPAQALLGWGTRLYRKTKKGTQYGVEEDIKMKKVQTIAIIAGLWLPLLAAGQAQQMSQGNKVEPLPRDLEIQLALSALPAHLREKATVYVLNP